MLLLIFWINLPSEKIYLSVAKLVTIQDPFFASFILLYSRVSLEAQYGFVILYSSHSIRSEVIFLKDFSLVALVSRRKNFGDKPVVKKMFLVINRLLATVGDTFVRLFLMSFCHQQLCFSQTLSPSFVSNSCHQKTFPFELIYHIRFPFHNTNSVVSPKYYLSIEIIHKISYLKIKGSEIELREIVYFGLDYESWY